MAKDPRALLTFLQPNLGFSHRTSSHHVTRTVSHSWERVSASSSLPAATSSSPSNLRSHCAATQVADPHWVNTRGPVTTNEVLSQPRPSNESQIRSAYIGSRLRKASRRKHDLYRRLADIKQREEQARSGLEELRCQQDQARLAQQKEERILEARRQGLEEAQAKYQAQQHSLKRTQDVVDDYSDSIQRQEDSVSCHRSHKEDVVEEIADLEPEQAQAARQADVLDLKSFEMTTLAKHAISNRAFFSKLDRMAHGTATEVMCRDIKSEVLDALTNVTKDELTDLVKRVLSKAEE